MNKQYLHNVIDHIIDGNADQASVSFKEYLLAKFRRPLSEGGWDSEVTQGTVIKPSTVKKALSTMEKYVKDFNKFLATKDIAPVQLGHPTGSSAYHDVDPEDKIYGDIDLQIIVPEIEEIKDKTMSQKQTFWHKLSDEFAKTAKPKYIHDDSQAGHPIVSVGDNQWVQIDLMPHTEKMSKWGRFRVTPERGMKGLLSGNMYSVLGDILNMSIQHSGVQFKLRDNARQPYASTRKNFDLVTLSTDIENFVKDIFDHEYRNITGNDPKNAKIDPLLKKHPGTDINNIKIQNLVNAVKGLANSFEMNKMYGKGGLSSFSGPDDFITAFKQRYTQKAEKDINSTKRDKATTKEARERAEQDRKNVSEGLKKVLDMF